MDQCDPFSNSIGPVIDGEKNDIVMREQEGQVLISQMDKYDRCSKAAAECMEKMKSIARLFNHGTIGVAHLVVAMTLIPNAVRAFQRRKVDADTAFRSAMLTIVEMPRAVPGDPVAVTWSDELVNVLLLAGEIAESRDNDNQSVSVDDMLTALSSLPEDAPAAQSIRGGNIAAPPIDIRAELELFAASVGQKIREMMPPAPATVVDFQFSREVSELRNYLQTRDQARDQSRDSAFDRLFAQLVEIRSQLAIPKSPEADKQANENVVPPRQSSDKRWFGALLA